MRGNHDLEYGQKAGRRVGAAVGYTILLGPLGLLTLFSKKRKHYPTIGYTDPAGKDQVAVLELGKDIVRATLPIVETRSGKKIEYQDDEAKRQRAGKSFQYRSGGRLLGHLQSTSSTTDATWMAARSLSAPLPWLVSGAPPQSHYEGIVRSVILAAVERGGVITRRRVIPHPARGRFWSVRTSASTRIASHARQTRAWTCRTSASPASCSG